MPQSNTRKVTFSSIVGTAAFRQGIEDFQRDRPFNPAYDNASSSAWHYERGRLYAAACAGANRRPLPNRVGRYVNRSAISDFAACWNRKEIL